ncbi:hypothetical protein EMIHUDRAFT_239132 [Emiliania huxleyi CCMP1516]|uniref:Aminotransferase class V domain-containing protein n=2 Tax=Emiliania huxleyi TaxID=2903 RepID=A0A0D3JJW9_EMIH1|nr:hypothetical protein EMIHUDRAFT_239132 [Emiliania huxleyi CCMP1516]EOD23804.1 hypothetical protein EMIHUDRAFT_239132 [Emiliania huxleyi CCMP1516]|eukprot:XP_005776233.1 hypothetical protein EMIHUDRAFT_239132 [Emiliania huxleyi CCMP1516]
MDPAEVPNQLEPRRRAARDHQPAFRGARGRWLFAGAAGVPLDLRPQEGIAIRSGHHCTQPLHAELVRRGRSAYDGSARASLYIYNTHARGGGPELESTIELFRSME